MKGVIETIPSFIYIIAAIAVGLLLFSLLYNYSDLFRQKQVILEGDKNYIARKIADEIENCWKLHRNGLDSVSGICKKLTINSADYITEKDVTEFLDCQSIPNINCTPENCSFCTSDYFNDLDKIKWFVKNKKAIIEISYLGFERVIKVNEIRKDVQIPTNKTLGLIVSIISPNNGDEFREGDIITFDSFISGGAIVSYSWSFGDGATGTGKTQTHSYLFSGIYTVTLTVTDNKGVEHIDSVTITII